ncbi:hypothetical protein [Rheinheimera sp.]|uniref:hypothetical protein n=1 Tax=Rheinheimera sp. TaxID=1869214 RepID=UPI00307F6A0A
MSRQKAPDLPEVICLDGRNHFVSLLRPILGLHDATPTFQAYVYTEVIQHCSRADIPFLEMTVADLLNCTELASARFKSDFFPQLVEKNL